MMTKKIIMLIYCSLKVLKEIILKFFCHYVFMFPFNIFSLSVLFCHGLVQLLLQLTLCTFGSLYSIWLVFSICVLYCSVIVIVRTFFYLEFYTATALFDYRVLFESLYSI